MSRDWQQRIGLGIAAALIGAWLAIHVYGIFAWRPEQGWLLAAGLILIQTWLSTGLFILAHDAMHGALVPGRPDWNRRIGGFCLMIYAGISFRALAPKHAAHHRRPGTREDPDFHADDPNRLLPWFGRFFATYYSHGQFLRITAAVIVYMLIGAPYLNIILFWAVPAVLALAQLFLFGTYLPHRHGGGTDFPDHHNARSNGLSPGLSLLTCFHFGGYHHEHHLEPGAPWWSLPAVRRARQPASRPTAALPR